MSKRILYLKAGVILVVFGSLVLLLTGCKRGEPTPAALPQTSTLPAPAAKSEQPPSPSPFQPSPTPQPLAAQVGETGILLSDYQAELARFAQAKGSDLQSEDEKQVLEDMIDQALLAQAAAEGGFQVGESDVQARLEQLADKAGSQAALEEWMAQNGYTAESFRRNLARSMAAAWMRDQILADMPDTAEQVHALQILARTQEAAQDALGRLQNGARFEDLAAEYDPVTHGELGWFPRGYLPYPQIEEAAFSLQIDGISPVIETPTGFHILKVVEREENRPLAPDALLALQAKALQDWLDQARERTQVEIFVP